MKLASIVPIKDIQRTFDGQYAMMLAHLAKYYPKCQNPGCYKIMDNSLVELGDAVTIEDVWGAGMQCQADEIILPDVFLDGPRTIASVMESIDYLYQTGKIGAMRLMAVCQGKNAEEFERCFRCLSRIPEIHCIGIPKITSTLHPDGRPHFEYLWHNTSKAIHLLGCWTSLDECRKYKHPQLIRSIDTCIPALNSMYQDGKFGTWSDRPKTRTIDLINDKIDDSNYECILYNLKLEGLL